MVIFAVKIILLAPYEFFYYKVGSDCLVFVIFICWMFNEKDTDLRVTQQMDIMI